MNDWGKKIGTLVLTILALSNMAFAQDVDDDAGAFSSTWGAQMRMLQLSAAVEKNIVQGELILDSIGGDADGAGDLAAILAEMQALLDDIDGTVPSSTGDGAQAFVDLKQDAVDLTREFRTLARTSVRQSDVDGLRRSVMDATKDYNKAKNERIRQARIMHNRERALKVLNASGINDPGLIDDVQDGKADAKDVRNAIKDSLKGMNHTLRRVALYELKESSHRMGVFMRVVADKASYRKMERAQQRIESRLEKAKDMNHTGKRYERWVNVSSAISARMDNIEGRMALRADRLQERTEKRLGNIDLRRGRVMAGNANVSAGIEDRLESDNLSEGEKKRLEHSLEMADKRGEKAQDVHDKLYERAVDRSNRLAGRMALGGRGAGGGDDEDGDDGYDDYGDDDDWEDDDE